MLVIATVVITLAGNFVLGGGVSLSDDKNTALREKIEKLQSQQEQILKAAQIHMKFEDNISTEQIQTPQPTPPPPPSTPHPPQPTPGKKQKEPTKEKKPVDSNNDLVKLYNYLHHSDGRSPAEAAKTLDEVPTKIVRYHKKAKRYIVFPTTDEEKQSLELPSVPPAPTGEDAIKLSRKLGWPDHWKARQRPELFILGPPKTGTTFLEGCLRWSMFGNSSKRYYPLASERWPTETLPGGEPLYTTSPVMEGLRMWNRTGYRRWDPPKEWWTYPEIGRYANDFRGFLNTQRFPPVEEESKNWFLIDSTPDMIMVPKAAQALAADLESTPYDTRFLVMERAALSRAYSHFLLFTQLRVQWGWGEETTTVFADKLDQQHAILEKIPICNEMMYKPAEVLRSYDKTYLALRWCMYDPTKRNQVMFLPFGFTALGVRYWFSKFNPKKFTFLKMTDFKKIAKSPEKLHTFYEHAFPGLKRNKPKCERVEDWNSGTCTGWHLDEIAEEMCGPNSPALKAQAWTGRTGLNYTKGPKERLEKYETIADGWTKVYEDLLNENDLQWYKP
eukprot:TRINITY_DN2767_c0_g2_i4.p1 TRINITY_DN2767_c0_g2~~TRINITY_DN2767_c0_g2_i4.p1  ORF type:complete len:593 (+),score=140.19 TRINITY_DN2767_c0_g2_i4:108-1781(+)